ncbi:sigma-54-dependent transcriptional regulator [Geomonas propionica]|uniref:Sigma-54-dependent Fis family transcriptional regulator n=1 Tax=Geomonas propionica TaxID=2798582 RepID=A0ABS0YP46_9BACT|nr:sigma 54-interacting transcriptional regulator [Geomonas propionica]MBJ6799658.1 sigma-54-dependent Fis family transcriptional regulator [Geomonas propionica]
MSRALHVTRKHPHYSIRINHLYPGNFVERLEQLFGEMREGDDALIVLLHAEKNVLRSASKLLTAQPHTVLDRITVSASQYAPDVLKWAQCHGLKYEVNEYETARRTWTPQDPENGTTLEERRWIQYRLMRVLIAGECPAEAYQAIIKKLRNAKLSDSDKMLSQRFYEYEEPDMAGGSYADKRRIDPNAIDLLRERAVQVGRSGLNTLLVGETGTGKESLAWYLHDFSTRHEKPFLALNCAFFEGERLESELFGHELGAFTDAKRMKKGLVEEAAGGTLFLDELPEMSPRVQAKLLRFLQDGSYTRLGGTQTMRSNVRIISAAQPGRLRTLRDDLYYRVADVELHTVPLRQMRPQDIGNIACNLAYRLMWRPIISESGHAVLTPDMIRATWNELLQPHNVAVLAGYAWPGNMRELSTYIKRLVLLGDDIFKEIMAKRVVVTPALHAASDEWQRFLLPVSSLNDLRTRQVSLKELQSAYVRHVVASLGGRAKIQPTKLAEALGCTYNTLVGCLAEEGRRLS